MSLPYREVRHPLVTHRKIIHYIAVWSIIMIAHTAFLFWYQQYELRLSLIDSLVFNLIVGGMSFGYGYAFRYISIGNTSASNIVSYASLVMAGVLIVLFGFKNLMPILLPADGEFISFVQTTMLWRVTVAAFYFAIVIMVYYLLKYSEDLHDKVANEARLEQIIQQTELDALKSQLNPHFIFNSLNSISSLTISNPEKAQQMVIKLSDFLRNSLQNDEKKTHSLSEEIDVIKLYLDIEKTRFGDRLIVNYDIDDHSLKAKVPNMILQPLFENAIKYGLYDTLEEVQIVTKVELINNQLNISITNPYDPKTQPKKGRGIGLKNTEQRLKIHYGFDHMMKTSKTNNTFTVQLIIPQYS